MDIKGFQPISERPQFVKMLLYGQAGAGKTRFCADAPKPIWMDFESSTETLRHWPEYKETLVKRPSDTEELLRDVRLAIKDPDVDTVIIDSITTSLDYFLRQKVKAEAEKTNSKRKDRHDIWESDYKYATSVFTELFSILQEAPINIVLIGHERISRDTDTNRIDGIFPDVTPRLQQAVTRLVNVVAYMQAEPSSIKGTKRRLYVNRTNIIEAKNRLNIQETYIEGPEWKSLFND